MVIVVLANCRALAVLVNFALPQHSTLDDIVDALLGISQAQVERAADVVVVVGANDVHRVAVL